MERQIQRLKSFTEKNHYSIFSIYKDIGSGLNTNRKGLWRLLNDCRKNKFLTILINFKDRLTRFGYKYLENYFSEFEIRVICVNRLEDTSPESKLVEDLIAIVHSFSGKMYRMRRTEKKKVL